MITLITNFSIHTRLMFIFLTIFHNSQLHILNFPLSKFFNFDVLVSWKNIFIFKEYIYSIKSWNFLSNTIQDSIAFKYNKLYHVCFLVLTISKILFIIVLLHNCFTSSYNKLLWFWIKGNALIYISLCFWIS